MVSEDPPAGEAEATTKPLFNKIGYDNEVKIINGMKMQENVLQSVTNGKRKNVNELR